MINILVSTLMVIFGTLTFSLSNKLSTLNRGFMSINYGVMEKCMELFIDDEGLKILYEKEKCKLVVQDYYQEIFRNRVKKITLGFYFYNSVDGTTCTLSHCSGVNIHLQAEVLPLINFDRSISLEIQERNQV